jgi:hypothetical protein
MQYNASSNTTILGVDPVTGYVDECLICNAKEDTNSGYINYCH